MDKLPQELQDRTIDLIKGDSASLKECALTMQRWMYQARKHNHSSVSLTCKADLYGHDFYESQDVARFVREVCVGHEFLHYIPTHAH